jgi:hypothetical protein
MKKVIEVTYGIGGYDPSKPNDNIVSSVTLEKVDGQWLVTEDDATRPATPEEIVTYGVEL